MANEMAAVSIPDKAEIEAETSKIVATANELVVTDAATFSVAGEFLKRVAGAIKLIHERVDPVVEAANAAHKAATRLRADLLVAPTLARSVVSNKMTSWEQKERERAAEAERAARAKAQAEEDEKRLRLAEKAENIGDKQTADAILETIGTEPARPIALPIEAQAPTPVAGVSMRDNWKVRGKPGNALGDLVKAAASNPALEVFLLPNYSALNQEAKLKKQRFTIPGFEAWNDRGTSVRT